MVAQPVPIKTRPMLVTERRLGRPIEEYLHEQYVVGGRTTAEIGIDLGVHPSTVTRWMALLGIEARFPGPRRAAV
jgi:hypothetical protein